MKFSPSFLFLQQKLELVGNDFIPNGNIENSFILQTTATVLRVIPIEVLSFL